MNQSYWLIFAIIGTFLWAIVNLIDDNLNLRVYPHPSFGVMVSGFFSVFVFLGLFFLPFFWPPLVVILVSITSGAITTVGLWFYFKALKTDYPSVVVSLMNLSPIFVALTSFLFFHEILSLSQYIGLVIILVCSTLITLNIRELRLSKAYYFMGIASIFFGSGALLEKYVYNIWDFFSAFLFVSIGAFTVAVIFFVGSSIYRKHIPMSLANIKKNLMIFFTSELINLLGVVLISYSISLGPVSLVKSIESMQALFVLILSIVIFRFYPSAAREALSGHRLKKLLCIIFSAVGLYLLEY